METVIVETEQQLDREQIKDYQVRLEYLKRKIRDQNIAFSKVLSANKCKEIFSLERKLVSLKNEFEFFKSETNINTKKELVTIFMTRKQKGYVLGADVSGTTPAKDLQLF